MRHPVAWFASLLWLISVASAPAATADDLVLELPVACEIGKVCNIQNYFDHDPGPARMDYACGRLGYDGHDGTDIRLPDMSGYQGIVAKLLSMVAVVLPEFLTKWTTAWSQSPLLFTALTLLLIGLILYARKVARFIHLLAEAGWSPIKQSPARFHEPPAKGFYEGLADRVFENPFLLGLLALTDRSLMWLVVGLGLFLLIR